MKKLLFTIILSASIVRAQTTAEINPDFKNTWLNTDFYNFIIAGKIPSEFPKDWKSIKQIYFDLTEGEVLMGTFREGMDYKYEASGKDSILLKIVGYSKNEFLCYLLYPNGYPELHLEGSCGNYSFRALDKKYNVRNGVDYFINDTYLTGTYKSVDSTNMTIVFNSDGTISGIDPFNEYRIPIKSVGVPVGINTVLLLRIVNSKVRDSKLLHWERSGDRLLLYNLKETGEEETVAGRYADTEVMDLYLTLTKVSE